MALSKNSIYGIGVLVSLASVLAATFLGVMPLVNQANTAQEETKTFEQSNVAKQARIELLEAGSADYDNIVDYVNTFLRQAPSSVDVAGLSTAVSAAVQKSTSVEIVSFNFLDQEPVTDRVPPEVSLEGQGGQVSPFDVEAAAPAATTATGDCRSRAG